MQLSIANKVLGVATLSIVGLTGVVNSAEAASLTGTLNIAGTAVFANGSQANPATDTITFSNATVQAATTTDDFDVYDGATATIADIFLTQVSGNTYSGTTVNPFISITPDLTFIADHPFSVNRQLTTTTVGSFSFDLLSAVGGLTGKFVNSSGANLGAGVITANSFNSNGSFSMTLTAAEAVPEPTTTLGLLAVGGLFAAAKRNKKQVG
jgi:hypothetical protein